jgi:ribonuclease HI
VALVAEFDDIKLSWVPREENAWADALAGEALREHRAQQASGKG